jgi:hypothetical protein
VVPYEKIKFAFRNDAFYSKYNKWVSTINDKELNIHRSGEKIDLSEYYANRTLLKEASGRSETRIVPPTKMSVMKFGGGGEQEAHRRMKQFIANNPSLIGLPASARSEEEYPFWSGDRADILFRLADESVVIVEIKPSGSPDADIYRGLHQCIKYEALIRAEQILDGEKPDGTAILVVGRPIPHVVADHARRLKVRLIADVKVK